MNASTDLNGRGHLVKEPSGAEPSRDQRNAVHPQRGSRAQRNAAGDLSHMTRSQNRRIKAGQRAFLDDLELKKKKKMCLAYETEISGIGRDQVAKAIEYGRFLNELYDADFATRHEDGSRLPKGQQPRYWKKWSSTVKQWGLNEKTLSNYRLLADEARDEDFAVKLAEFSLLTDAYRAARRQRSERKLEKARSEYDHALGVVADSSCADRAISLEEASA